MITEANVVEYAARIAEALVVSSGKDSAHWDLSAEMIIATLIAHIVLDPYYKGRVHLGTVRDLLAEAGDETGRLKDEMLANVAGDGIVVKGAKDFFDRAVTERMGVLSTARKNLRFLDLPEMRAVLEENDFELSDLKTKPATIYICLPARHLGTCDRFMRIALNLALQEMERVSQKPVTGGPVLFMMDEMATLGYMKSLELATSYIAGFFVKFLGVWQDTTQIKSIYGQRWESFLGNSGTIVCFGNNDLTSLEWISRRCGRTAVKVARENPMSAERSRQEGVGAVTYNTEYHELLAVPEIANLFGRSDPQCRQLIIRADGLPVILQRVFYDLHDAFRR